LDFVLILLYKSLNKDFILGLRKTKHLSFFLPYFFQVILNTVYFAFGIHFQALLPEQPIRWLMHIFLSDYCCSTEPA